MINFYNLQVENFKRNPNQSLEDFINTDPTKISWSRGLKSDLLKQRSHRFNISSVTQSLYRPYCKQWCYFDSDLLDFLGSIAKIFPIAPLENLAICVTGTGVTKSFDTIMVNTLPDIQLEANGQAFPLYTYTKHQPDTNNPQIPGIETQTGYTRNENIPDTILQEFRTLHKDPKITKTDIFYYIYGILHSPEYKTRFAADLKKMLPRIPHAADFWAFSTAGKNLAHWHLNYETIEPYPIDELKQTLFVEADDYQVTKMQFGRKNRQIDKTTIVYNHKITLSGIPLQAYDYKVCDRSAIEWIMERYQITKNKDSGIVNNPNDWSDDPHYIVDLVKRIVRVSLETVAIVNNLPPLNEQQQSID
jgi:predicted helicase